MKRKLLTVTIGTGLVLGLAGCGGSNNVSDTSPSDPAAIFSQSCASCHGGQLQGGYGPNLKKVGSAYSKQQILDIINKGKNNGKMPAGLISGADAEKVAAWLAAKK